MHPPIETALWTKVYKFLQEKILVISKKYPVSIKIKKK